MTEPDMMTESAFAGLMHGFADLDAPTADERVAAIHRRVTRVRRRRAACTAAGVAVIMLAAGGVAALVRHPDPHPPAPATSPRPTSSAMPSGWTADDGYQYRLIKVVTMDSAQNRKVVTRIPATGVITIRAFCDMGYPPGVPYVTLQNIGSYLYVGSVKPRETALFGCGIETPVNLDLTSMPSAHGETTLAFERTELFDRSGPWWTYGIYQWVPPTISPSTPPAPVLPASFADDDNNLPFTLQDQVTGVWPADTTARAFHVPAGTIWAVQASCSDALRSQPLDYGFFPFYDHIEVYVNGHAAGELPCAPSNQTTPSQLAAAKTDLTVTLKFHYRPLYLKRTSSWSAGLYFTPALPDDSSTNGP